MLLLILHKIIASHIQNKCFAFNFIWQNNQKGRAPAVPELFYFLGILLGSSIRHRK